MTTTQANQLIGQTGTINISPGSMRIEVRILDAKAVYGEERLLVTPVAGSGAVWVAAHRFVSAGV